MPVYFMHLHECGTIYTDGEGRELPDLPTAREHALHEARHIMSQEVLGGALCLGCCIVVEDVGHHEVLRVAFRDALAVTGI